MRTRVRRTRVIGGSGYWAEALRIILVHDVIIAVICIMRFIIIATVDILVQPLLFGAFRSPFECLRLAVELVRSRQVPRRGLVDPL